MTDEVVELNNAYNSTYVAKISSGEPVPCIVYEFSRNGRVTQITYAKADTRHNTITETFNPDEWDMSFPMLGAFNVRDSVVYATRPLRRQWRKGMRGRLVIFENLFGYEYKLARRRLENIDDSDVLSAIYSPKYFSYEESFDSVMDMSRLAAAFSREFYICRKAWSEHLLVGYKHNFIGVANKDGVELFKGAECLKESLEPFINVEVRS